MTKDFMLLVSDLGNPTSEISEALTQHAEAAVTEAVGPQVEAAQSAAVVAGQARDDAQAAKQLADQAVLDARAYAEQGEYLLDQRGDVSGTLDLSALTTKNIVHARLVGNLSITLPTAPQVGQIVSLVLRQDATGGRTLIVKGGPTPFSVPITLSTAANSRDLIHLMWDGVDWNVLVGGLSMGVAAGWMVA